MARPHSIRSLLLLTLLTLGMATAQPFPVTAGASAGANLQLAQPVGLAAARSGSVYVLDWTHPHVVRVSPAGIALTSWPVTPALASNPGSVAVDAAENVYVLRNVRHGNMYVGAITRYSSTGRWLATWFNGSWLNAAGLAAGAGGTLSVLLPGPGSEKTSAAVITVSPRGKVTGAWHLSRYGYDYFEGLSIVTDPHGNIYVAGIAGNCSRGCQGYDAEFLVRRAAGSGRPIRTWTSVRIGLGLVVVANGTVFTAGDYYLMKTSAAGTLLARWGSVGCGPLKFRALTGLTIDGQSNLYLLDSGNDTIQKVSTSGQSEALWGTCPPTIPPTPIRPTPKPTSRIVSQRR